MNFTYACRRRPGREVQVLVLLGCVMFLLHVQLCEKERTRVEFQETTVVQERLTGQASDGVNQTIRRRDDADAGERSFVGQEQEDPALVAFVRRSQLVPPSPLPYNLTQPRTVHFAQHGQSKFAEKNFLKGMRDGFFVEAGALDGQRFSNSLYFERERGWIGLLVEPDPPSYAELLSRHRKAYSINAGLSFTTQAGISIFRPAPRPYWAAGRVGIEGKENIQVKVFPFYTLLLALHISRVDFLSLDIEGDELKVLQTIPWGQVRIRLLCIEINHVPGGSKGVMRYMEAQGYLFLGKKIIDVWFGLRELLQETMDVEAYLKKFGVKEQREKILNQP